MDDDKIELYEIKRPLLGTAVGRGWLTLWSVISASWKTEWTPLWEKIVLGVQRHYLKPVYLLAFILTPFWVWLIAEIIINLFIQLATEIPAEHNDKRAHFYAIGLTITGLGAVLAAPFVLIKAWVNERQARNAEEALFNDRFNTANGALSARRQVTRVIFIDDQEQILTEWEDDLVSRNAAIEALEGLAEENNKATPRIARILSVYVREMSHE